MERFRIRKEDTKQVVYKDIRSLSIKGKHYWDDLALRLTHYANLELQEVYENESARLYPLQQWRKNQILYQAQVASLMANRVKSLSQKNIEIVVFQSKINTMK